MSQFVDEIAFTRECLRILCSTPEDNNTRMKQKNCASLVLQSIAGMKDKKVVKEYVDLLDNICNELISSNGTISGSVLVNNIKLDEYPTIKDQVIQFTKETLTEQTVVDFINFLDLKIKSQQVLESMDEAITSISKIRSETSLTKTIHEYERLIQSQYIKLLQLKENEETILNEVILSSESGTDIIKQIIQKLSIISQSRPRLDTGFSKMNEFLKGGFEATRIYIFGGKPGLGKSTLLINFLVNSAKIIKRKESSKPPAIVYITLENDMVETMERFLACLNKKPVDFNNVTGMEIEQLVEPYNNLDVNVICEHMKPHVTTSMDIFLLIDKLSTMYRIVGVFIDYLNLVSSSSTKYTEKRHELGAVTSELKNIGRHFQCPVIVPAQLNTEGYDGIPTMRNLDESRQIAQNADFIGLMFQVPEQAIPPEIQYNYGEEYDFVGINIDKNRNGKKGLYVLLGVKNCFTFKDLSSTERESILAGIRSWSRSKRKSTFQYNNNDGNNPPPLKQTISDPYKNLFTQKQEDQSKTEHVEHGGEVWNPI